MNQFAFGSLNYIKLYARLYTNIILSYRISAKQTGNRCSITAIPVLVFAKRYKSRYTLIGHFLNLRFNCYNNLTLTS